VTSLWKALVPSAGWKEIGHNEQSRVVSFERNGERMNVYPTTGYGRYGA